ncbi:ABC transporter permease [Amycolatopsis magusensis]|uniref:NitT/TauT family transport system permease protein n=1 Tax=Amycolatopsis magusensis TaxID=882444 RepID=A0ABS4Q3D8_9PSEU|nr:ABC transporter permease [Amycolatopsis magusensis]MBP2186202.1 NitT/TauT family transport system permease protein [Amycolatopsis magusensis]MDI5978909.1 ABC transporter permease [Amycolatopsis magusensis]
MRPLIRNLAGLAGFFLLWEAVVRAGLVNAIFLPPPTTVFARAIELLGQQSFLRDVVATMLAWAISLGISILIAVPAGLLLGSVPAVRVATRSLVEFLRPIPSVALIPLVILLVGGGPEAKITLAVYAATWPILYNTIYALDEIDPLLLETARSYGTGRTRTLAFVALPHAAPFVFTGIRMSASIALILVVSTEFLAGASRGIGNFILDASAGGGRSDLVLAGTVVAGIIGFIINDGLERLGKRWFRWSTVTSGAQ